MNLNSGWQCYTWPLTCSNINLLGFFNLTPKVYVCIYTYFDINKIYKSQKAGQLLLNLNKKIPINKGMWQRVLPLLNFQC